IVPAHVRESSEVTVGAAEDKPMLEGERGEMGVLHEVRRRRRCEETAENLGVSLRRRRDPDDLEREPLLDLGPRPTDLERPRKYARIGRDPEKGDQRWPG